MIAPDLNAPPDLILIADDLDFVGSLGLVSARRRVSLQTAAAELRALAQARRSLDEATRASAPDVAAALSEFVRALIPSRVKQ